MSLRLLNDLVEYASLDRWWDDGDPQRQRSQSMVQRLGLLRRRLRGGTVSERAFDGRWLETALESSFSLANAFDDVERSELFDALIGPGHRPGNRARPRTHWLFLCKHPRFAQRSAFGGDLDLGVAAHLLARALDRGGVDLHERAVVAVLGNAGLTCHPWEGERPGKVVHVEPPRLPPAPGGRRRDAFVLHEHVRTQLQQPGLDPESIFHVVCYNPADPDTVPAWWDEQFSRRAFHRLIYLTPPRDLRPSDELLELLLPGAWDPNRQDGPFFSSVIPTVVLPPKLERRWYNPFRAPWTADLKTLEVAPGGDADIADAPNRGERRTMDQHLRRDLCRIRLDPRNLAQCDRDEVIKASLDRWARAVTNRQVGLALSGGGATSAALVPFIEELQHNGIPIDVVGGLSGGAILGLYVATGRLPAYYDIRHRWGYHFLMPTAIVFSEAVEMCIDVEFGGARVDDLDTRFVPMTVEIPTDGEPRACAVVGGTLGEGVRVSGIALGWFSPAERRGTRYVDGGVAVGVPSGILPRFGADLVIACNSIVPPNGRLPNALVPESLAQCLRYLPVTSAVLDRVLDRFSDFYIGFLTMLRETARSGARDADVYYEVSPEETPFFDAFAWHALDRIRRAAEEGRLFEDELERCLARWETLRNPRRR